MSAKDKMQRNMEHFETVFRRFKSDNSVPVERITITRDEFEGAFHHWIHRLTNGTRAENHEKEFEAWLNDPFTHWINDTDAAWQAWQERQDEVTFLLAKVMLLQEHLDYMWDSLKVDGKK